MPWRAGQRKTVKVFGGLDRGSDERALAPGELVQLYDRIVELRGESPAGGRGQGRRKVQGAVPWSPEQVEVLLTPFAGEPEGSVPWPAAWDRFERATHPRVCPSRYCRVSSKASESTRFEAFVLLPGSEWERLQGIGGIDSGRNDMMPTVWLDGRSWTFSYYLPFPAEERWAD